MFAGYNPFDDGYAVENLPPKPLPEYVRDKPIAQLIANMLSKDHRERKSAEFIQRWLAVYPSKPLSQDDSYLNL